MAAKISFEKSIEELEEIVSRLESGDAALDEALRLFERGVKLSALCTKLLDDAEQRVSVVLSGKDGEVEQQDFSPAGEE